MGCLSAVMSRKVQRNRTTISRSFLIGEICIRSHSGVPDLLKSVVRIRGGYGTHFGIDSQLFRCAMHLYKNPVHSLSQSVTQSKNFFFLLFFFFFSCPSFVCGMQDCGSCWGQWGAKGCQEGRGAPKPNQNRKSIPN